MPVLPLSEIAPHLPPRGALIGLDLGTKTIGVAASDPDRRLAAPVETVARTRFSADAAKLLALAAERSAVGFVLGLPINMDGSEGPRAQSTRAFARNFMKLTLLPIGLWDERLSTAAVERDLIAADVSRAKRASVILPPAASLIAVPTGNGPADADTHAPSITAPARPSAIVRLRMSIVCSLRCRRRSGAADLGNNARGASRVPCSMRPATPDR